MCVYRDVGGSVCVDMDVHVRGAHVNMDEYACVWGIHVRMDEYTGMRGYACEYGCVRMRERLCMWMCMWQQMYMSVLCYMHVFRFNLSFFKLKIVFLIRYILTMVSTPPTPKSPQLPTLISTPLFLISL